jgi:hypothetical protein
MTALALGSAACSGAQPAPAEPASSGSSEAAPPSPPQPLVSPEEAALPPAVLNGNAVLHCTIDSTKNGSQKLELHSGQGLSFEVAVSPIVDGVVDTLGPNQGGAYRFTSHLAEPGTGHLSGVGPVIFEELDTKVNVELERYQQPQGAGTKLTFSSDEMKQAGIYVEFSGRARAENGDRYAFRVTLGAPGLGSGGEVVPASDADHAMMYAKVVVIEAPVTTVVSSTTLQKLK